MKTSAISRVAVTATTRMLANGYQHTKADLERFAAAQRGEIASRPFLFRNHEDHRDPIAVLRDAWVGKHRAVDDPPGQEHYALYVRYEPLSGAEPSQVEAYLSADRFSISFMGWGVGNYPVDAEAGDLTVGLSPELLPDEEAALAALRELERAVGDAIPGTRLAVRRYHEHALEVPAALMLWLKLEAAKKVGGLLVRKAGEKLLEKPAEEVVNYLWNAAKSQLARVGQRIKQLKVRVETPRGDVTAQAPTPLDDATLRAVLGRTVAEALEQARATATPQRVGLAFGPSGAVAVHRTPLELQARSAPESPAAASATQPPAPDTPATMSISTPTAADEAPR